MASSGNRRLPPGTESEFPGLTRDLYAVTSEESCDYNCVAHAAGDSTRWWWPDPYHVYYWPDAVAGEQNVPAFAGMFGLLGYVGCPDGSREPGFEKVAIYCYPQAAEMPSHAAIQLDSGRWSSKLGSAEDIEHVTVKCLEGDPPAYASGYGKAVKFLRRPIKSPGAPAR